MITFNKGQIVNKQQCCAIMGWTRQVFDSYVRDGMPVEQRPSDKGGEYQVYTGDVILWCVRQAARELRMSGGVPASEIDEDLDLTAERARLTKEQADKAKIDNEQLRKELIHRERVTAGLAIMDNALKDRLLMVPNAAAPEAMAAGDELGAAGIAEVYRRHIAQALSDVASAEVIRAASN
jgi:phage terminase Nu1 subunit (DNA packaging protein)